MRSCSGASHAASRPQGHTVGLELFTLLQCVCTEVCVYCPFIIAAGVAEGLCQALQQGPVAEPISVPAEAGLLWNTSRCLGDML